MPWFHALAVIALSGVAAAAADPLPTETFKVLPLTLAVEAAQAAIAACKAEGFAVTAAVADRAGNLQVLLAGDGASVLSRDITRRKAYTGAVRRRRNWPRQSRRRERSIPPSMTRRWWP